MSPKSSQPNRGITVEDTDLPESPAKKLIQNQSIEQFERETVAGILLGLVRDCKAISPSVTDAAVAFPNGERIEIRLPNKTLRLLCNNTNSLVTVQMLRDQTYKLPEGHEWLVLTTQPLTSAATAKINERSNVHYICVNRYLTWKEA